MLVVRRADTRYLIELQKNVAVFLRILISIIGSNRKKYESLQQMFDYAPIRMALNIENQYLFLERSEITSKAG